MGYSEIWAGVLCVGCHRPLLVFDETRWKEFNAHVRQSALAEILHRLTCSDPDCRMMHSYRLEEFLRFRVEQIPDLPT